MNNLTGSKAVSAVNRVSNERMEDKIREAIVEKLNEQDSEIRLQEFELNLRKDVDKPIVLEMTVYGMAGDTTKDTFCQDGKVVKGGGSIQVELDNDTKVKFVFKEVVNLNATDYLVTYQLA